MAAGPAPNQTGTPDGDHSDGADRSQPSRGPWPSVRLRGLLVLTPCVLLLLAAWTRVHRTVAMPQCSFQTDYGIPCPSCGMTRSVEAAARLDMVAAWQRHPFGIVLVVAAVVFGVVAAVELATGRSVVTRFRPSWWWVPIAIGGMFAGWLYVLLTGWITGRLPK